MTNISHTPEFSVKVPSELNGKNGLLQLQCWVLQSFVTGA